DQYGDMSANIKAVEAWVFNTDVIDAINGATFDEEGVATITPTTGQLNQGQFYYNETNKILYFGLDDNIVTILTPNIVVDSTGVKWRTVVSTSGVLSTVSV